MTYNNATKYVKNAPDSHVGDHSAERLGYLFTRLDDPQKRLKYIRLAGTNGKTICKAMIASVLSESGYTVCELTLSPLDDVRNNIRINRTPLEIADFTALIQSVSELALDLKKQIESAKVELIEKELLEGENAKLPEVLITAENAATLTKSEILLLAALIYSRTHRIDLTIIESKGENDPSLCLPAPFAAVICGAIPSNDTRQIMHIKNYIKRGTSEIVSAPDDPRSYKAISDTCAAINCRLSVPIRSALTLKQLSLLGTRFVYANEEYRLSLCGRFQTTNAITAIETFKLLRRHGFNIPTSAEKQGLEKVKVPARFEVLSLLPTIIADSTYKSEAVETVCESLFDFSEITGRDIALCLPPDLPLIKKYFEMLTARGYKISELYTVCDNAENISTIEALPVVNTLTCAKNAKALVKLMYEKNSAERVLLVSGHSEFTSNIRLEIVRKLQF